MKLYVSLLHLELTREDNFFWVIYNGENVELYFCSFTQRLDPLGKWNIGSQVRDRDLLDRPHGTDYLITEMPIEISESLYRNNQLESFYQLIQA